MEEEREPALVASIIETECYDALKEKDYYSQIRSIKFNLSDPKNPNFRSKVRRRLPGTAHILSRLFWDFSRMSSLRS